MRKLRPHHLGATGCCSQEWVAAVRAPGPDLCLEHTWLVSGAHTSNGLQPLTCCTLCTVLLLLWIFKCGGCSQTATKRNSTGAFCCFIAPPFFPTPHNVVSHAVQNLPSTWSSLSTCLPLGAWPFRWTDCEMSVRKDISGAVGAKGRLWRCPVKRTTSNLTGRKDIAEHFATPWERCRAPQVQACPFERTSSELSGRKDCSGVVGSKGQGQMRLGRQGNRLGQGLTGEGRNRAGRKQGEKKA